MNLKFDKVIDFEDWAIGLAVFRKHHLRKIIAGLVCTGFFEYSTAEDLAPHNNGVLEFQTSSGLYSCDTKVTFDPRAPVVISQNSLKSDQCGPTMIASGPAANIVAQRLALVGREPSESETYPRRSNAVPILLSGALHGALFQPRENVSIYVGSRHLFQGLSVRDIEKAFFDKQMDLSDLVFLEGQLESLLPEELDVIFVVSGSLFRDMQASNKGRKSKKFLAGRYILEKLGLLAGPDDRELSGSDLLTRRWGSWQWGTLNDNPTMQFSKGEVSRVSTDGNKLWLDGGQTDFSSPRSSSSLVWIQDKSSKTWHLAALVECLETSTEGRKPEVPRAITLKALSEAVYSPVTIERLTSESRRSSKTCIPVDGRGAGGK